MVEGTEKSRHEKREHNSRQLENSFKNGLSQRLFFLNALPLSLFQRFHISTMSIQRYSMLADSTNLWACWKKSKAEKDEATLQCDLI